MSLHAEHQAPDGGVHVPDFLGSSIRIVLGERKHSISPGKHDRREQRHLGPDETHIGAGLRGSVLREWNGSPPHPELPVPSRLSLHLCQHPPGT